MEAGKLNRLITIQKKLVMHDSYGQAVETWNSDFTTWASMVTSGGSEFYAAQKLNASTTAVFKVRYTQRIQVTNRVVLGNRVFEILSINEIDGMRTELAISCKEVI